MLIGHRRLGTHARTSPGTHHCPGHIRTCTNHRNQLPSTWRNPTAAPECSSRCSPRWRVVPDPSSGSRSKPRGGRCHTSALLPRSQQQPCQVRVRLDFRPAHARHRGEHRQIIPVFRSRSPRPPPPAPAVANTARGFARRRRTVPARIAGPTRSRRGKNCPAMPPRAQKASRLRATRSSPIPAIRRHGHCQARHPRLWSAPQNHGETRPL